MHIDRQSSHGGVPSVSSSFTVVTTAQKALIHFSVGKKKLCCVLDSVVIGSRRKSLKHLELEAE